MNLLQELPKFEERDITKGFSRFRFGFAEPGETYVSPFNGSKITMVGNYRRKKDAENAAALQGLKVHPYLYGKLPRGWSVYKVEVQP
jgi:hypothetical protein